MCGSLRVKTCEETQIQHCGGVWRAIKKTACKAQWGEPRTLSTQRGPFVVAVGYLIGLEAGDDAPSIDGIQPMIEAGN